MTSTAEGLTSPGLVLRALERWGDRPLFSGNGGSFTYAQARDRLARMQAVFAADGLKRGERVAVLTANRADGFLATNAAQALGLGTVPLHPLGSFEDQSFILEDMGADWLVVDAAAYAERGGALAAAAANLKGVYTFGPADFGRDLIAAADAVGAVSPVLTAEAGDIAWFGYTGGTTGRSKGAVRRHPSAVAVTTGVLADFELPQDFSYLSVAPISHVGGTKLAPGMLRGGRIHFHHGFDPDRIFRDIAVERLTMTLLVPTMVYLLLDHPGLDDADLTSLELLIYGAAPMSPTRLLEGLDRIGPVFSQLYGQTECYPISVLRREDHDPARPDLFASCGHPVSSADVALLDEDDQPVPPGDVGEICARAPQTMDQYWNRPEQTAETLANGWLHTGDMARADDRGYLYIVDRKKDMIISGGFNVFPREVEDVLSADPAVAQAAVIGVPDEKWGEAVKAIVQPRPGQTIDPEKLIAAVKAAKGAVQAPKTVDIVDDIPVTPLGKPDKKALRAQYWAGRDRMVG